MVELATVYLRSIIGITCLSSVMAYGMYLSQVSENVLLAYLAACIAMVVLDKTTEVLDKA